MNRSVCDRLWELDALRERRLSAKDAEAFERHLQTCGDCASTAARDLRLRRLATSMRERSPDDLALRRVRGRVLRGLSSSKPPARWFERARAIAFGALAGVCAIWLAMTLAHGVHSATPVAASPSLSAGDFAGTVVSADRARWSRERVGGTERLHLLDGSLRVHVRRQGAGERFVVDLPDGELEVRGTTFEVSVEEGATSSVRVEEGAVALRVGGLGERLLSAGEAWAAGRGGAARAPASAPMTEAVAGAERRGAPSTAARSARAPKSVPSAQDDDARQYAAGVSLLTGGQFAKAAKALDDFARARPLAPQAEDASFLEAVALARAGRVDAAALAAKHHLDAYPGSFHAKEASILVARSARDRDECPRARAVLAEWLEKQDSAAVAALGSCSKK